MSELFSIQLQNRQQQGRDGVGLERGELLDVGFLVVVAAQLHLEVVGLEDMRRDLIELDGVINLSASYSELQHSLVFSQLILARWLLVSLIRQQLLSPSSVEQTDRHPSSLQVSSSRRL